MIFKQNTFYMTNFHDITRINYFQNDILYEICWWNNYRNTILNHTMLYTYTIEEILKKTKKFSEISYKEIKELVDEKNIKKGFELHSLNYISEKIENLIIKLEDYAKS